MSATPNKHWVKHSDLGILQFCPRWFRRHKEVEPSSLPWRNSESRGKSKIPEGANGLKRAADVNWAWTQLRQESLPQQVLKRLILRRRVIGCLWAPWDTAAGHTHSLGDPRDKGKCICCSLCLELSSPCPNNRTSSFRPSNVTFPERSPLITQHEIASLSWNPHRCYPAWHIFIYFLSVSLASPAPEGKLLAQELILCSLCISKCLEQYLAHTRSQ